MKKITDWSYNDLALYAKGWYERKDLWDDLGYMFDQIYGWQPKKHDIVSWMWRVLDKICKHLDPGEETYFSTFASVDDKIMHDMFIYDCDRDTAICYFVIGVIQGLTIDQLEVKKPVYGKGRYFRYGGGLIVTHEAHRKVQTMTYKQMNHMADEAWADIKQRRQK